MLSKRARPSSKTSNSKTKYKKTAPAQTVAMYKQPSNPVRFVRRNADYGAVAVSNLTGAAQTFSFRLSNVAGYSELVSLYDQYKISAVQLTFFPRMTQITSTSSVNNIDNVRILTAIDYNDATPPTTATDVREYENCEVHSITDTFSVYVDKPKILDTSSSSRTAWIATSSATTLHYGLKMWVEPPQYSGGTYGYVVEAVFYMAFKAIK